jgi:N-acetylglucosaminyl-diphospho-decaprenol L-rhamnosyltransferase
MKEERVCAIILDYNGAEKVEKCIASLANQNIETIYVLDNFATEASSSNLLQALNRLRLNGVDRKIKILSAGRNLGFGRGVNFVLAHDRHSEAPHDYYLLLNNDAVGGPDLVSGLLSALENEPQAALAAPRVVSSQHGREYGIWYHRYLGLLLSRPGQFRFHYFTGCCLLIPRHLVGEARLFDEAFFMYGEDTELGWRLTRAGKKMVCAKNVYVEHEYGPSVDRSSFFYEYHMARGHLLLSWKTWMHPVEIPFLLIFKLIGLGSRATARCCRYRTLTPILSLFVAWLPLRVDKT